jgi:capsular exopolysaccharide synthesis family protein
MLNKSPIAQVVDARLAPAAPAASAEAQTAPIDLPRLLQGFLHRYRLFAFVTISVLLVAVLAAMSIAPRFTATASVMLDPRREKVTKADEVLSALPADDSVVASEAEVLKSRDLAERVGLSLQLDRDPYFNGEYDLAHPSVLARIKELLPHAPRTPEDKQTTHRREMVDNLLGGLTVERVTNAYVINISYTDGDPDTSARVANAWASIYVQSQLEARLTANDQVNALLARRIDELREKMMTDDAAVQQYKIANNLLSAAGTNLTEQEISNYNQTLAQARAQVAEDEARLRTAQAQVAAGSNGEDVGEALSSPVVQTLRQQRAVVSARAADLKGRYGDRHPEMLKTDRELADIDQQIQAEIHRILSNLQARVAVSRQREADIGHSLSLARGTLASNNQAAVKLGELQRTADASRELYESYLGRYKETSAQSGIAQADARIVSQAKVPDTPSGPKARLNLALAFLLALASGCGSVIIAEALDTTLITGEEVESRLRRPFLAATPLLDKDGWRNSPADFAVANPFSLFAESFRTIRTALSGQGDASPQIVLVTSALPGEGKTTVALGLARIAAHAGVRTVLVDCDLRRRSVGPAALSQPSAAGWIEAASGGRSLESILVTDEKSNAALAPLASDSTATAEIFGAAHFDAFLEELRRKYEFIVLDAAPVLALADTRALAPKSDVVVMVAEWRRTPLRRVATALSILETAGAAIGGVVLSKAKLGSVAYLSGYYDLALAGYFQEPKTRKRRKK